MKLANYSKTWVTIGAVTLALGIALTAIFGLRLGIDFTGGTLLEVRFDQPADQTRIETALTTIPELDLGQPQITLTGDNTYLLRFRYLESETEQVRVNDALKTQAGEFQLIRQTSTGPSIGESLRERAIRALTYTGMAIIIYLAAIFRDARRDRLFRHVAMGLIVGLLAISTELLLHAATQQWIAFVVNCVIFVSYIAYEFIRRSASLKYGIAAILALANNLFVVMGSFAVFGYFLGYEVDALIVTALLVVLSFSVNDTIVVFDRLRENLKYQKPHESFTDVANIAMKQGLPRSVNTNLTILLTLLALFFFGAESIQHFTLALIIGIISGTFSSLFVATPLLVIWEGLRAKRAVQSVE